MRLMLFFDGRNAKRACPVVREWWRGQVCVYDTRRAQELGILAGAGRRSIADLHQPIRPRASRRLAFSVSPRRSVSTSLAIEVRVAATNIRISPPCRRAN